MTEKQRTAMSHARTDLDLGFRLHEWVVLPRQSSLRKSGKTIHIEPRVMGVLVCLAEHAPETVTREEIFEDVWSGSVVQDDALTRNISILRSHLDRDSSDRKYIQTVSRVGYRLVEQVKPLESVSLLRRKYRGYIAAATVAVVTALLSMVWLGANQKLDLPDFSFTVADLIEPGAPPIDFTSAQRTTLLNKQILILGGNSMLKRGATDLRTSIRLFRESLKADGSLIEAHLGLATAYALLPSYDANEDKALAYARARAELQLAVQMGVDIERTYATEAFIHLRRMEWLKAEQKFQLAITHDPQDPHLRQWYAQFLARAGRYAASVEQARISLALDPDSPIANHRLGASYTWAGENTLADEQFNAAFKMGIAPYIYKEPKILLLMRADKLDEMQSLVGAVQEFQLRPPDWVPLLFDAIRDPSSQSRQRSLDAAEEAWQSNEISPTFYFGVPMLLGDSKRSITALNQLLNQGFLTDAVEGLFISEMRETRADPAFINLVRELGLDAYWKVYGLPDVCQGTFRETVFCDRLSASETERSPN
jgi:DNA-binding winged helix-turn-helix (wHTH) protein/tetratricopeptide (TPR) repeat protein